MYFFTQQPSVNVDFVLCIRVVARRVSGVTMFTSTERHLLEKRLTRSWLGKAVLDGARVATAHFLRPGLAFGQ